MRAATNQWFTRGKKRRPANQTGQETDPLLPRLKQLAASSGAEISPLDEHTWVVQSAQGPRRRARRIGPPKARTHLVLNPIGARNHPRQIQQGLADYAAEAHIAWMLRRLDINVVLDVGANRGQFATKLRKHGYTGRIISFEPLAELAKVLEEASAGDPEWTVLNYALGEEDGTAEINARPGAMSSLLPTSEFGEQWHENLRKSRKETIQIRRLDTVYADAVADVADPKVYLKLDTQGFDLAAFNGGGEVIKHVQAMQSEVSCVPIYDGMPKLHETLPVYEEAGFAINGMFPVNFDAKTARVIEFDMVLIRDESSS